MATRAPRHLPLAPGTGRCTRACRDDAVNRVTGHESCSLTRQGAAAALPFRMLASCERNMEFTMPNNDELKGKFDQVKGKAKQAVGHAEQPALGSSAYPSAGTRVPWR